MTEVNQNPFIPFPPQPFPVTIPEWLATDEYPEGHPAVAVPPAAGILLRDLLPMVEQSLVDYAYRRRVSGSSRMVVYFSQHTYDFMATSGLDLRMWARVRGAVIRTLPSSSVFLSFLAGSGEIKDHLFMIMEEGDL